MKAKKSLGQNFLVDKSIITNIVRQIDAKEDDLIMEIGPGRGAITKELKKYNASMIAYELDNDLKPFLSSLEDDKFQVKYQDILKSNINDDIKDIKYNNLFIVGNLPYYITTPIIEHIIKQNVNFKKLVIMVQKEVADRFLASEGSKDYGYMTLVLKYYFDAYKVCDVSKLAFNPVPKVESSVVGFIPKKRSLELDVDKYFNFLKDVFKQKRKTLKNNLKNYDQEVIKKFLVDNNLCETIRAEELSEELIIKLFRCLNNDN